MSLVPQPESLATFNGAHFYVESTTTQQWSTHHLDMEGGVLDPDLWARSPDDECRHDRLPFDRTAPCGCFPQEGAAIVELPVFVQAGEHWERVA